MFLANRILSIFISYIYEITGFHSQIASLRLRQKRRQKTLHQSGRIIRLLSAQYTAFHGLKSSQSSNTSPTLRTQRQLTNRSGDNESASIISQPRPICLRLLPGSPQKSPCSWSVVDQPFAIVRIWHSRDLSCMPTSPSTASQKLHR